MVAELVRQLLRRQTEARLSNDRWCDSLKQYLRLWDSKNSSNSSSGGGNGNPRKPKTGSSSSSSSYRVQEEVRTQRRSDWFPTTTAGGTGGWNTFPSLAVVHGAVSMPLQASEGAAYAATSHSLLGDPSLPTTRIMDTALWVGRHIRSATLCQEVQDEGSEYAASEFSCSPSTRRGAVAGDELSSARRGELTRRHSAARLIALLEYVVLHHQEDGVCEDDEVCIMKRARLVERTLHDLVGLEVEMSFSQARMVSSLTAALILSQSAPTSSASAGESTVCSGPHPRAVGSTSTTSFAEGSCSAAARSVVAILHRWLTIHCTEAELVVEAKDVADVYWSLAVLCTAFPSMLHAFPNSFWVQLKQLTRGARISREVTSAETIRRLDTCIAFLCQVPLLQSDSILVRSLMEDMHLLTTVPAVAPARVLGIQQQQQQEPQHFNDQSSLSRGTHLPSASRGDEGQEIRSLQRTLLRELSCRQGSTTRRSPPSLLCPETDRNNKTVEGQLAHWLRVYSVTVDPAKSHRLLTIVVASAYRASLTELLALPPALVQRAPLLATVIALRCTMQHHPLSPSTSMSSLLRRCLSMTSPFVWLPAVMFHNGFIGPSKRHSHHLFLLGAVWIASLRVEFSNPSAVLCEQYLRPEVEGGVRTFPFPLAVLHLVQQLQDASLATPSHTQSTTPSVEYLLEVYEDCISWLDCAPSRALLRTWKNAKQKHEREEQRGSDDNPPVVAVDSDSHSRSSWSTTSHWFPITLTRPHRIRFLLQSIFGPDSATTNCPLVVLQSAMFSQNVELLYEGNDHPNLSPHPRANRSPMNYGDQDHAVDVVELTMLYALWETSRSPAFDVWVVRQRCVGRCSRLSGGEEVDYATATAPTMTTTERGVQRLIEAEFNGTPPPPAVKLLGGD